MPSSIKGGLCLDEIREEAYFYPNLFLEEYETVMCLFHVPGLTDKKGRRDDDRSSSSTLALKVQVGRYLLLAHSTRHLQ